MQTYQKKIFLGMPNSINPKKENRNKHTYIKLKRPLVKSGSGCAGELTNTSSAVQRIAFYAITLNLGILMSTTCECNCYP